MKANMMFTKKGHEFLEQNRKYILAAETTHSYQKQMTWFVKVLHKS